MPDGLLNCKLIFFFPKRKEEKEFRYEKKKKINSNQFECGRSLMDCRVGSSELLIIDLSIYGPLLILLLMVLAGSPRPLVFAKRITIKIFQVHRIAIEQ